MVAILCVIAGLWLAGSVLFILALALAAKKRVPAEEHHALALKQAA